MKILNDVSQTRTTRRTWLGHAGAAVGLAASHCLDVPRIAQGQETAKRSLDPTRFQLACMTLPYREFPLKQALEGIKSAGFAYVAWGLTHREESESKPVRMMPADAPPSKAKELGQRCRDVGLEPVMMFSNIYPEAPEAVEVFESRIRQAEAAGIGQVLTFGHTEEGAQRKVWIERFKKLGPIAGDHGVMIVIKQHGGSTGTGQACAEIVEEIGSPNVKVNYDGGNVMDYLNVDPISDITSCAQFIRSFCIKDHRDWPKDQDCGPGYGEIDHYRLLAPVAFTGLDMPLCFENIFAPLVPRPTKIEEMNAIARQSRVYLEEVILGLQTWGQQTQGNSEG